MPLSIAGTGNFAAPDQLVTSTKKGPKLPKPSGSMKPPTVKSAPSR